MKCQSFANPSVLEYWHIGETTMRFASVRSRKVIGSKRCGITLHCAKHEAGEQSRRVGKFTARRTQPERDMRPLTPGHFFVFVDECECSGMMFTGITGRFHSYAWLPGARATNRISPALFSRFSTVWMADRSLAYFDMSNPQLASSSRKSTAVSGRWLRRRMKRTPSVMPHETVGVNPHKCERLTSV